ncbi:MAG: AsmA-like C-terminal region-containing protein [Paludibacter sp.]
MNPKTKKLFGIISTVFIVLFAILLALPYLLRDKIMQKAKTELNKMLNAKVDFEGVDMSFIRNFPYASVKLENFYIAGIDEFEKDTLLSSDNINLILNIKSLFSGTGYDIRKLEFNDSRVVVRVLSNGKANWDILKEDSVQAADTSDMNFHWKLKEFTIHNADIFYNYDKGNMLYVFKNVNHRTSGDLTADSSLLVTRTTCDSLSFIWDGIEYISKAKVELNADIDANLNDMIFTFSKNSSRVNEIPFAFAGWLKSIPDGWDMDFKLNAEKVDFKAILSMIPAMYSESFEEVKAGGKVNLNGFVKGRWIGDDYPAFDLSLKAVDGWFQYPALPKSVQQINVDARITNPGKTLDETVFDISRFSFLLGGNPFSAQMRIAYPMTDTELQMKAAGKINLGMIKDVYPLDKNTSLNGLLDMNLDLTGRMSYYDNNQYDKFRFAGKLNVSDMLVKMKSLSQDISVAKANMTFNNRYVDLTALQMKIGRNDVSATGKLENAVAYVLHDKTLKGQLNLQSDYLNVNDFMPDDKPESKSDTTVTKKPAMNVIQIPSNIDFSMQAAFKQLIYEKMNFTNAFGQLKIAGSELKIQDMNVNAFGGTLVMNGSYNVVDTLKPKVAFDLSIKDVVFNQIAGQIETIQQFVPVFDKASGKFSAKLSFNSLLKSDMMPDLNSIFGKGSFTTKSVELKEVPALDALAKALKKDDLLPMSVKDLALLFEISDGKLITKPFSFKVSDITLTLGGLTGLDKTIAYQGKVQLPDKYNLGKLSTFNLKIGGTFSKPKVEVDLKNTVDEMLTETAAKVESEIHKKVDETKEKALEEARKQKEKAMQEAQIKADKLIAEAKMQGDKLIAEAKKQGDKLIAQATNPLTKKAAQLTADKLMTEARKKADELNTKAKAEAQKLIQTAADNVEI